METDATAHAEWARLSKLARLFRDNPRYRVPDTLTSALRAAISTTVFARPAEESSASGVGRNAKKQSADRPPRSLSASLRVCKLPPLRMD
jgi:hypothetical protein